MLSRSVDDLARRGVGLGKERGVDADTFYKGKLLPRLDFYWLRYGPYNLITRIMCILYMYMCVLPHIMNAYELI